MSTRPDVQTLKRERPSFAMRLLLRAASSIHYGSLEIHLPGQSPQRFSGPESGPAGILKIENTAMFTRLLRRGDLGFAEAYMAGEWTTPDLSALLTCLDRNIERFGTLERGRAVVRWFKGLQERLFRRNNRRGSLKNIAYHYDLGNDFYRLWLDDSLTYSSANFSQAGEDLASAQANKYEHLLSLTDAKAGDHLLEIGCGWGSFAIHAAQSRGCQVTSLTLSREQYALARQRVQQAGVADKVDIRLQDYRDVRGQFDHVVSIEMFEAVGEAYWPVFFDTLQQRLKPGGRAALQVITIDDAVFEQYRREVDFIREYIFPGGFLPSPSRFDALTEEAGLKVTSRRFKGDDYAKTLGNWGERFQAVEKQVLDQGYDQRFIRMWEYYLAYCEAGFRNGRINLLQTALEKT